MALVETPIHWLWLARGAEIILKVAPTVKALVVLDNHEKSIDLADRLPLKVPLIWMSVRASQHPTVEGLMADQLARLLERARSLRFQKPNLYGILKSKGPRGGVSSGASGSPLTHTAEVGFACLDQPLLDTSGFTVMAYTRVGDLNLPAYVQENDKNPPPPEEVPRVSRYDRKWVI